MTFNNYDPFDPVEGLSRVIEYLESINKDIPYNNWNNEERKQKTMQENQKTIDGMKCALRFYKAE